MPNESFDIVGGYNNQRFPNIDAERTINMFEFIDVKSKKPATLISSSGLQNTELNFTTPTTGGCRAEFVLNGFEYLVFGQDIWRRDQFNNIILLNGGNPLPTATGYVGVDANNNANGPQILFVDGVKGCIWDTKTLQFTFDVHSVDANFPLAPIDVCFIDGFLVVANGNTNNFQLSSFNDAYSWGLQSSTFTGNTITKGLNVVTTFATGMSFQVSTTGTLPSPLVASTTYFAIRTNVAGQILVASTYANAIANINDVLITTTGTPVNTITNFTNGVPGQLQQGSINTHPGNIVACRTLHRRVFLFSANFTEVWENSGFGTNLPLRRNNALLMEYGTPSAGSIVTGFDKMIFLAQDRDGIGSVMEVIGTESIPISNRALDFQLAQYASANQISDARGIFIKDNGVIFYRLNFTAANVTYVYNVTFSNPQSDEGKKWTEEQVLNGNRHPAQTHGFFNGNNFYGHFSLPILYQVSPSFVTNDGESIKRVRIGKAVTPSMYNRTRIDRFTLDIIQGLPIITNMTGILDLLAENGSIIDTESNLDILLEASGGIPLFATFEPPVFLSYSKNGATTFGPRLNGTMGAIGDFTHRTVWRKLGTIPRAQGFVPKIEFFSQVPFIILGAAWVYEVMPE